MCNKIGGQNILNKNSIKEKCNDIVASNFTATFWPYYSFCVTVKFLSKTSYFKYDKCTNRCVVDLDYTSHQALHDLKILYKSDNEFREIFTLVKDKKYKLALVPNLTMLALKYSIVLN